MVHCRGSMVATQIVQLSAPLDVQDLQIVWLAPIACSSWSLVMTRTVEGMAQASYLSPDDGKLPLPVQESHLAGER